MDCDWDPATVYNAVTRKAAKDHKCDECRGTIRKGENYEYVTGLWDGQWSTFRTCPDCIPIRCEIARLPGSCDGWMHGGMLEELDNMNWGGEADRIIAAYNASVAHRGGSLINTNKDD
jgi:hypothetical protein